MPVMSCFPFFSSSRLHRVGTVTVAMGLAVFLVLAGCDSHFADVNTNPNEPEEVTPNLLLPDIIRNSVNTSVNTAHTTGNLVLQYVSKVSFATGIDRYDWSSVGYWDDLYGDLRNVEDMTRIARERDNSGYEGVGLVLKSWLFSMLTNAYGDIPYSEAHSVLDGEDTPAYDRQEEVYVALLSDLETANDLLAGSSSEALQGDILYDGDLTKWRKLANSLRLRLLMRLSEKQGEIRDVDVRDAFSQIVSTPSQNPVFEANADNAALEYLDSRPNQWPRHTSRVGTFRTYRMSQTLTDTLTALDDPRLSTFADTTVASEPANCDVLDTYVGVPNGLTDDASNEFNGGRDCQSSLNTVRYFESPNTAEGLIMTYAEVLFLKAEAAEREWINSNAESHYEAGIEASMNQYDHAVPSGYLSNSRVAYASGDQDRALEQIGTQKWIAFFYTGMEGWFNWRRTGHPNVEPSVDNVNSDQIPVRFRYPESEQALNADSYQSAIERQGPNNINTEMWLLE